MNFWELFAPEYQQMIKERGLARLRGENPPARYEVRLQTGDGKMDGDHQQKGDV